MHGKLSAGAKRFIDSIVQPKMPWRDILERFVSKRAKTDRSFSRPNRRFFPLGLYLPAMSGESLGRIAIAVDCSGSINDATLQEFAAEITAIKKLTNPSAIDVYYFDSEVSHEESYGPSDELDIKPHGGGGTAFSPVINAINSKAELPVACVFLTDLYCSDFGDAPDYPVLWVSNGRDTAPWGEVITMN
jgi:predicted metal-dependent peptidase